MVTINEEVHFRSNGDLKIVIL